MFQPAVTPAVLYPLVAECLPPVLAPLVLSYVGTNIHGTLVRAFPVRHSSKQYHWHHHLVVTPREILLGTLTSDREDVWLQSIDRQSGVQRSIESKWSQASQSVPAHMRTLSQQVRSSEGDHPHLATLELQVTQWRLHPTLVEVVLTPSFWAIHRGGAEPLQLLDLQTSRVIHRVKMSFLAPDHPPVKMHVVEAHHELYVTDFRGGAVWVWDTQTWQVKRHWAVAGTLPRGICVLGEEVFLLDTRQRQVHVFSPTGELLRQWEYQLKKVQRMGTDGVSIFLVSDREVHWYH